MNKKVRLVAVLLIMVFGIFVQVGFGSDKVFAGGGAVVGIGDTGGGSGGGGYWGGSSCKNSPPDPGDSVDCRGVSWIFYRSTGNRVDGTWFEPEGYNWVWIDEECSAHTDENGGFWHFGRNAMGNYQVWYPDIPSYFLNFDYLRGITDSEYSYSTSRGYIGHWDTYGWGYKDWQDLYYKQPSNGDLSHSIYRNGTEMYYAQKSSSKWGDALTDWGKACSNYNSSHSDKLDCSSYPWGLKYFCYWDGIEGGIEGKSTVGNQNLSSSKTTDWVMESTTADTYFINDCSSSGCKVKFSHSLRRKGGSATTEYSVNRVSNYDKEGVDTKTLVSNKTEDFSGVENGTGKEEYNEILTLKPGQVVCETLSFKDDSGENTIKTTACASALGNAQPPDPDNPDNPEDPSSLSGDSSFINIKVRNESITAYNKFQREVYAKPGDSLEFRATYNPVLQYTYYLKPEKMRVDNGTIYPESGINKTSTLSAMFNLYSGDSYPNWNNGMRVSSTNFATAYGEDHTYSNGSTSKRVEKNKHEVVPSEAGRSLQETAKTNVNAVVKTTPSQVEFSNYSGANLGKVVTTSKSNTAYAYVPYNFRNTTKITTEPTTPLYAGETQNFKVNISILQRKNNTTNGTYATKVPNARHKFEFCYNGGCTWREEKSLGILNSSGSMTGASATTSSTLDIPDVPAGTEVCLRSAVYPKDSHDDKNLKYDAYAIDDPNSWVYSERVCYKVAKRPSLQVWGGNLYSSGGIQTSTAVKKTTDGYTGTHIFGSWSELGIIAGGRVTGLASGAGMGYTANNNGSLSANPGGSTVSTFCDRSTLSFANQNCSGSNGYVGEISAVGVNNAATNVSSKDRDLIKSRFGFKDVENNTNVDYYYDGGNYNVGGETINSGVIKVYQSDETITITGNLQYENASYKYLTNIGGDGNSLPKLMIMAKNININCNVDRIDGLLIADEVVTTCADSNDINAKANSKQLKVNGAIIAGKLVANRTYGAGTGDRSIIPAEIINFDVSLYSQANPAPKPDPEEPGGSESQSKRNYLDTTYVRELAPRY